MRYLVFIALLAISQQALGFSGIKIYIATVEKVEGHAPCYNIQLVVCNNQDDTVFINREQLEMVNPIVTNDVADIADGAAFYFISNVDSFIDNQDELRKYTIEPDWHNGSHQFKINKELAAANDKLPMVSREGKFYYRIAPGTCITMHTLLQSTPVQLFKLHKVKGGQEEKMKINFTLPATYYTHQDKHISNVLLIARDSEDLKEKLLKTRR